MDRECLLFKKGCQKWHCHLERCAKEGRIDEIEHLHRYAEQCFGKWRASLEEMRAATREAEKRVVESRRKEDSLSLRMRMLDRIIGLAGEHLAASRRSTELAVRKAQLEHGQEERKEAGTHARTWEAEHGTVEDGKAGQNESGGDNE
jgi:hypothetical protein